MTISVPQREVFSIIPGCFWITSLNDTVSSFQHKRSGRAIHQVRLKLTHPEKSQKNWTDPSPHTINASASLLLLSRGTGTLPRPCKTKYWVPPSAGGLFLWMQRAGRAVQLWPYLKWNCVLVATTSRLMSCYAVSAGDRGEHSDTAAQPARPALLPSIVLLRPSTAKLLPWRPWGKILNKNVTSKLRTYTWSHCAKTSSLYPVANKSCLWTSESNRASVDQLLMWFIISPGSGKQWCWDFEWQRWHPFNIHLS